jgi:hypothetical protein
MIDEFLARSGVSRCHTLKETAEAIAKVGFKMFLGVTAQVASWSADEKEFSLVLDDNPLTDFVELPEGYSNLFYSNILCGVIRGALEMVPIFHFTSSSFSEFLSYHRTYPFDSPGSLPFLCTPSFSRFTRLLLLFSFKSSTHTTQSFSPCSFYSLLLHSISIWLGSNEGGV